MFNPMLLTAEATGMGALLGTLGEVVTWTLTMCGAAVTVIVDTPFLLLTTGVLMLGAAVGIMGRLLSRN